MAHVPNFSLDFEPAECQKCLVRSHHLGWSLRFMLPKRCMTPDNTIQLQPYQLALCSTSGNLPVSAQLSMRLLNQERLFYRLLWNPFVHHALFQLYPTKVECFSSQTCCFLLPQLSDTVTLLGLHFFVLQQESVLDRRLKHICGSHICFPSLEDYNFVSACCSMSQNSCVMYFSPFCSFQQVAGLVTVTLLWLEVKSCPWF